MNHTGIDTRKSIPPIIGIGLIAVGIVVLVDQVLKTDWIIFAIVPIVATIFMLEAYRTRKSGFTITGCLIFGLALGGLIFLSHLVPSSLDKKIGYLIIAFALGWAIIPIFSRNIGGRPLLWAFIPAGIIFSVGLCFVFSHLTFLDFVLYIVSGVGLTLLIWGLYSRLFGLIIAGSLLVAIGPGIYMAWGTELAVNGLTRTGMMLVIFSLGWALMVLFARKIFSKFIWWPLIPGGVLAMVGWGLYIGGDPGNAGSFIANTGSISLIIFGLYLILMRKSIRH